jgi:hypothetical protein
MKTILHRIKAYLYDNVFTDGPHDYIARVNPERTLNIPEICSAAIKRNGASTTEAIQKYNEAVLGYNVDLFLKEMTHQLCNGRSVDTGYFTARVRIKGVFSNEFEAFNANKHTLCFDFNQGDVLCNELSNVVVDIKGVADSNIDVVQVTDVRTGSINDLLAPNSNLIIRGHELKIVGDNPAVGVWFINRTTGIRICVDISDVIINKPSELVIVTPGLEAGTYLLEATSQFANNALLKEPHTTVFDKVLTVL